MNLAVFWLGPGERNGLTKQVQLSYMIQFSPLFLDCYQRGIFVNSIEFVKVKRLNKIQIFGIVLGILFWGLMINHINHPWVYERLQQVTSYPIIKTTIYVLICISCWIYIWSAKIKINYLYKSILGCLSIIFALYMFNYLLLFL